MADYKVDVLVSVQDAELKALKTELKNLTGNTKKIPVNVDVSKANVSVDSFGKRIDGLQNKMRNLTFANGFSKVKYDANKIFGDVNKVRSATKEVSAAYGELLAAMNRGDEAAAADAAIKYEKALKRTTNQLRIADRAQRSYSASTKLNFDKMKLSDKMNLWLKNNSNATEMFGKRIEELKVSLKSCDSITFGNIKKQFEMLTMQAEIAGKTGLNVRDRLINQFKRYGTYLVSSFGLMGAVQGLQQMYQNVKEVDTAMTELKRVTDLTATQYSDLYGELTESARKYGTTLSDIINATADWSRAGFDPSIAKGLAEVTTMYQHIADVDYQTAFENLQTAYKGFESELTKSFAGDTVAAVGYIGDILNELDNNFAVTAEGVGEALKRSASALSIAGNSIQETSGMVTGITEVTQDPEKAGNALKVLSMRLRGMKGELEDLGEDVDSNISNLSKMQGQILKLTHGKVNIFNDVGEFKSTYEIMQGIAEIYDELSTIEQADLLETIAGKHRANDVAALISNWKNVEEATKSATEATGSAEREHAKYVDSIQGRLNSLTSVWQTFSNEFLSTDLVKGAISALTGLLDVITAIVDKIGLLGTVGIFGGLIYGVKNFGSITSAISDLIGAFSGGIKSAGDFGAALKLTGQSIFSSFSGAAAAIGVVTGVISAIIAAYKNYKEELRQARQATIDTSNSFNESLGNFEQAYIKYADRTALTVDEEADLKNAIDGTVNALGDKASALKENIGASNQYFQNLDKIAKAEAEQAKRTAAEAKVAAEENLKQAEKQYWWSTGENGKKTDLDFKFGVSASDEYKDIEDLVDKAKSLGYTEGDSNKGTLWFRFSADDSIDTTISKLNMAEQMRDRNAESGNIDNSQYEMMTASLEQGSALLDEIIQQTYNEAKATYQVKNGIATNVDEFYKMREAVLAASGDSVAARSAVGELMNEEYKDIFDFSSVESQIDYIKSVTKDITNIGTGKENTFETFLDIKTRLNNGECTVGEYHDAIINANEAINSIEDVETQNFLRVQLGLELDAEGNIDDEVEKLRYKLIRDLQQTDEDGIVKGVAPNIAKDIADSLSKTELEAAINIVADGELDLGNLDVDKFNEEVRKRAELIEAKRFTIDVKGEKESIEALNTALQESRSATGLTAESIDALKGRYQSLDSYDAATLFQETANGITLNAEELNKLNSEYVNLQKNEIMNDDETGKLDILKKRYDELTNKIREETDAATKAKYINEREDIRGKIVELAECATQLDALTSSYNEWQNAEAAGNDRDLYASVYSAQENIKKELDNGWIDDGTMEYFQLIWGEDKWDGAGKSIQDYRDKWNTLDDTIKGTSYSIQDFFKVNEDGELTSEGIFNFFDAVGQKQKERGEDWIQYDKDGNMKSFNFGVDGDKAIADALGISEELVQIFLRASQDAGFVVNFDGAYTQLADLQNEAIAATNKLNRKLKTKYSFDFDTKSIKEATDTLSNAKKKFADKGIFNLDENGNITAFNKTAKGAQEAMTVVSALQANLDQLDNKYIGLTVEDKGLEEPLEKLQDYETKVAALNQLELDPQANTEEIEKVKADMEDIVDYFYNLDDDTKKTLKIEGLSKEQIQEQVETGTLEIPTTLDIQTNMNETLEDLRDLALLNSGILTEDEEQEIRLKFKIDADSIDISQAKEKVEKAEEQIELSSEGKERAIKFLAENDYTDGYNETQQLNVIKFVGDWSEIEGYEIEDQQVIVEYIKDIDDIETYTPEDKKAVCDFIVNNEDVMNYTPEEKNAIAKYMADPSQLDSFKPEEKEAVAKFIAEHGEVDAWKPKDRQAIARFLKDSAIVDGYIPPQDKTGIVTYEKDSSAVEGYDPPNFKRKVTYYINKVGEFLFGGGSDEEGSDANGTAHVDGTAFANGTSGKAFNQGNWGTKDDGVALGGELGQELVVRDGRWFTIGDNGAEFFKYKKNDIIFNAGQTKQLFEQGKITNGRTRGMVANANGTAFASGKKNTNAEIAWEMKKAKSWFKGMTDAQVKKLGYENIKTYKQFLKAIENGAINPIFGNVNMDNREIITWNKKNKNKYKKALKSWDEGDGTWYSNVDSSSYDTVHGGSGRFGVNIDGKGIEVAYSPIVVDENGKITNILSKKNLNSYIEKILKQAYNQDGKFKQSTILSLDTKKIIAGIDASQNYGKTGLGNSAVTKGMLMHFSGKYGAIQQAKNKSKYDGSTFANGSKDKDSEVSLGGEVGTEILVRDGRWYAIGDDGAEFFGHKKNDIIFDAQQSKQLFEKGKITHGNGRGKALASGTAFSDGNIPDDPWDDDSSSGGSNKKKSSSSDKDFKETFDWIEIKIDRIERAISRLDKKFNNTFIGWTARANALNEEISKTKYEIGKQEKAYSRYIKEANKAGKGLDKKWKNRVKDGTIDISTIKNKNLAEKIKNYKEWYDKAIDCKKAIDDLEESERELIKQQFDFIGKKRDYQIGIIDYRKSLIDEKVAQQEAQGHVVSTKYYDALKSYQEQENKKNASIAEDKQAELEKNVQEWYKQKAAGIKDKNNTGVKPQSEEWYREVEAINELNLSVEQGKTKILEYDKTIRELKWENMDRLHDKISQITDESEFLIELMSNDKLYDDKGQFTDKGQATAGLRVVNYQTYMEQAKKYAENIKELNAQIAADPRNEDAVTKRNEYVKAQREAILAAEKEKDAIKDLVEEGINKELDSLQKLIDKKQESLESEKSLYDYQKKVKNQTKEIAALEKQMAAYAGDNSEEAKAKIQELKVSLEEAKDNLEETEYDKYVSDQKEMLDNLYDEYEEILNKRLDDVDALLKDMIAATNESKDTIKQTLEAEASGVSTTLSESMNTIWTSASGVISGVGTAVDTLAKNLQDMFSKLDVNASNEVKKVESASAGDTDAAQGKEEPKKTVKPTTPKKQTTTPPHSTGGDGKAKVGDKVTFSNGKYHAASDGSGATGNAYLNKGVYITKIKSGAKYPYLIGTKKGNVNDSLGWVKLSQIKGYATGKRNLLSDEFALTQENGAEMIVRPSDGAILTPLARGDSVLNAAASGNIWDMANNPADFIKNNLGIDAVTPNASSNAGGNYSQNIENVSFVLPNVKNYDQMLAAMQKDKNFERLINAMTIDQVAGKSKLGKGKAIR